MDVKKGYFVFYLVLLTAREVKLEPFNTTAYYTMPKLSSFDDYDRCSDTYCVVNVHVKPNSSSTVWQEIVNFSSDWKHHFRHDLLQRGVCLERCRSKRTNDQDPAALIHRCVNREMRDQFRLEAEVSIEYCLPKGESLNLDHFDRWFIIVTVGLVALVVIATTVDYLGKKKKVDTTQNPAVRLLLAFSLSKNLHRLSSPPTIQGYDDFKFIQAARFFTNFLVIMAHVITICFAFPLENPEFIERKYHELSIKVFLNGLVIIQSFFTITGFLQASFFLDYAKKHTQFDASLLWKSILYRYVRLTPVYAYMLFLDATLLVHAQSGPMWPRISEEQRSNCRKNWWTNLLYVNNYVRTDEPCIQPTWYLAADFQLFIVGMMVLLCIWKFPRCTKLLVGTLISIAWIIPAVVNYVNLLDGVTICDPESMKTFLLTNPAYMKMHIPMHTNLGCYMAGLLGGLLYDKVKTEKINLRKYPIIKILWYLVVPAGLANILSGEIFYENDLKKPSIWMSAYSTFNRNMWGLLGIVFLMGMIQRIGFFVRVVMNHPVFRPLGRLTYCAFICHLFVLRCLTGDLRQPLYVTNTTFVVLVSSTVVLSYFLALILCLCIEFPTSAVCKLFLRTDTHPDVVETKQPATF